MKIFISVLILFTIIGCYLNLDNPQYYSTPIFDPAYLLYNINLIDFDATYICRQWEYGIISIICFIYAALKDANTQKWVLIIELFITLIRYFFIKDGYYIGFAGGASENVVFYDFFAFSSRVLLLLIAFNFLSKSLLVRIVIAIVSAIIIIKIKMLFFRI